MDRRSEATRVRHTRVKRRPGAVRFRFQGKSRPFDLAPIGSAAAAVRAL